ncbi:hypothetical protein Bbelb_026290 [Branchiostoma belcheri]|nr:hypothetical protein Bbelb_026290 [Branchiostoma belcheri]
MKCPFAAACAVGECRVMQNGTFHLPLAMEHVFHCGLPEVTLHVVEPTDLLNLATLDHDVQCAIFCEWPFVHNTASVLSCLFCSVRYAARLNTGDPECHPGQFQI